MRAPAPIAHGTCFVDTGQIPVLYIGLKAIAERITQGNRSKLNILRTRYGLDAYIYRMPHRGSRGWRYATDEGLVRDWQRVAAQNAIEWRRAEKEKRRTREKPATEHTPD